MFNKYYQQELQFLRDLGEEFAEAYPQLAYLLAKPQADPDVERLLEGFAFLAGQIRQKLDDEFPEITHGLMSVLWPHYLRPIPSMSILEFQPVIQTLRRSQKVPRGVEVQSIPVEGTPCRFRTCYEVVLQPIALEDMELLTKITGPSRLRLRFRLAGNVNVDDLDLARLRMFLFGDASMTFALYLHLCRHFASGRVTAGWSDDKPPAGAGKPVTLRPVGFGENEDLIPYSAASFPGYRLLQEYFSLPEKFLFIDLVGLEGLKGMALEDRFQVEIEFDRQLETSLRPTADEMRLNCTPVINLFPHEADPIRIDHTQTETRLRPSGKSPLHYEIFSIESVSAFVPGTAQRRDIQPFHSFVHSVGGKRDHFYLPRLKNSVVDDRVDTYLAFVDQSGNTAYPPEDVVSVDIMCSNRRLPESLRVGEINVATDSSPESVRFQNLTKPSFSVAPPLGQGLHWRLISHMSLNYISLVNVEALRGILQLYNFAALRDPQAALANTRRLQGIQAISAKPMDYMVKGIPLRGLAVAMQLLEDHFAGDGDLFLFSSVMNEFLSLYGTVNSFTRFEARGVQRGESYLWPPRVGNRPLL
jgi:type VI secretion system protein ImpG